MPELRYDINVGADTAGAPKAESAIRGVTTAANEANAAASAHAAGAAQMWSGLQQSAQGGAQAVMGLGRALGGAIQAVVGAVPFAKWLTMAATVAATLKGLWDVLRAGKGAIEPAKTAADDLTTAQDASKRSAEALAKTYSEGLTAALKSIAGDAADAIAWQKQLAAAHEEVAKSVDNQTKAEITLKKEQRTITAAQAATQLASVDAAAEARQAKNRIDAIRIERDEMQKATERAASVAAPARDALETLLAQRSEAQSRQRAAVTAQLDLKAATAARETAGLDSRMTPGRRAAENQRAELEYLKAKERSDAAVAAAPSEETMKELDASLAQAWKDWNSVSAPVQELAKKTAELSATLDLRTKTEKEVLQHNQSARAAENAPAISDAQKAKNEAAQQKAAEVAAYKAQQLTPQQWAGRIAGGMVDDTQMEALKKTYPTYKFPAAPASSPSTASTPSTPGGVYRPGEALPTNTTGVYRPGERLPGSTLGAGNQVTRGPLAPGSDTKAGAIVPPLKETTKAMEGAPTGEATVKAAEELATKTKELTQAQQASADATVAAINQCIGAAEQIVGVQQQTTATVVNQGGRITALEGAVRSLRAQLARA